jgi:hypothetical protein
MSLENDETLDLNPLTPLPQPQQVNGRDTNPQPTAKSGAHQTTKKGRKDRKAYSAAQAESTLRDDTEKQVTFPLRKPGSLNFFRVCLDPESRMDEVYVIDGGMDGFFLIHGELVTSNPEVRRRVKRVALYTCINHAGKYFVWPVALGNPKSAVSSFKAIALAEKKWLRLAWNAFAQAYDQQVADPELYPELVGKEPTWRPSGPEILDEAFNDNTIDEMHDPRLKKLLSGLQ